MQGAGFGLVAGVAEALAAESGRLKKRAMIVEGLLAVAGSEDGVRDAGLFCLYLAGQAFAEADARKLNVGGALLTRALKEVSGCTDAMLTAAYRRFGDLGAAAFEVMQGVGDREQRVEMLTLEEVEGAFGVMAAARSTAVRSAAVEGLLRQADALEVKYLVKLMLGDMRIGVKQSLVEEAIAVASGADLAAVRHAVMLEADLAGVVARSFAGKLGEARMRLFHPLGFMLASPVETPEEAVARFGSAGNREQGVGSSDAGAEHGVELKESAGAEDKQVLRGAQDDNSVGGEAAADAPVIHAFLEDKYDGMRAQVHCGDPAQPGRVAVYSRNREEISESFPEIVEAFAGVREPLILDGELLGWDFAAAGMEPDSAPEGRALPFSVLGQRIGRKRVDAAMRREIPAVFMAFDLLFEGGELLLPLPLRERRQRLEAVVRRLEGIAVSGMEAERVQGGLFAAEAEAAVGRLMLSPASLVESAERIGRAYDEARARANEGVMIKAAGSAYQPGRRGLAWVKLKRELATLDVVITGAEFGHGRRAGLLSDYTFAVRSASGELLNVGKAYSGVTDAEILELTAWLQAHTLEDMGHFRTVEPLRVLEVAFNNVMRSDRHASGFALRFPRILRIRDDKPVEEIDTVERVEAIYQGQPDKGRG